MYVAVELQLTALSALCFVDSVLTCSLVCVVSLVKCRSSKTGFSYDCVVDSNLLFADSSSSLNSNIIWSERRDGSHSAVDFLLFTLISLTQISCCEMMIPVLIFPSVRILRTFKFIWVNGIGCLNTYI